MMLQGIITFLICIESPQTHKNFSLLADKLFHTHASSYSAPAAAFIIYLSIAYMYTLYEWRKNELLRKYTEIR